MINKCHESREAASDDCEYKEDFADKEDANKEEYANEEEDAKNEEDANEKEDSDNEEDSNNEKDSDNEEDANNELADEELANEEDVGSPPTKKKKQRRYLCSRENNVMVLVKPCPSIRGHLTSMQPPTLLPVWYVILPDHIQVYS
jgi:hypothetical protein